jgi:DNA-3-methyladenine glycosylase
MSRSHESETARSAPDSIDIGDGNLRPLLAAEFFEREPAAVARELLGHIVVSTKGGELTAGRIVETEAYLGKNDPGSHAATRGMTPRNAVMFGPPAHTYVYFTYGNHHMLNIVCDAKGEAGAVLIRALEPLAGMDTMRARRGGRSDRELTNGPGKLAQALGLDLSDNAARLGEGFVAIVAGEAVEPTQIVTSGRVGLSVGHELELRYFVRDEPHVSKGRTGAPRARRCARGGGVT